jgi:hypothetical protein
MTGVHSGTSFATNELLASTSLRDTQEISALLSRFEKAPHSVLNEPPPLADSALPEELRFSIADIESGKAIAERDRERSRMCMTWQGKRHCLNGGTSPRAGIEGSDLPEALTDNGSSGFIRTLEALESEGLTRASLPHRPWSGDAWAYYKGILGARYADPRFPGTWINNSVAYDWRANRQYVHSFPARRIDRDGSDEQVDKLSPSEKYELLIGDKSFSLTEKMWKRGQNYYEDEGHVASWLGICHGWAAAAFNLPRPKKTVTVRSADGRRDLNFYPSDIKALASYLWAEGESKNRFLGGRCRKKSPAVDANGRILDPDCFDANPGSWHLAVTNQIGISHRSLVMDATYDYRIWNQPIFAYSYRYFNPRTMKVVGTIEDARVALKDFDHDRFHSYRSSQSAFLVGIVMDLTYMQETHPSHSEHDSSGKDRMRTIRYLYDLELDASGKIIGGEWYQNKHPDFLWVPEPGQHAASEYENMATEKWDPTISLPKTWQSAAHEAAEDGQALGKIVETLVSIASSQ